MKNILVYLLAFALPYCGIAQKENILKVKISDYDGQPVSNVTLQLLNTRFYAVSDRSGYAEWKGLENGDYKLFVTHTGYASQVKDVSINKSMTEVDIVLQMSSVYLDEVVVTSEKKYNPLANIPIAVTALPGSEIQNFRINQIKDISAIAPNLSITNPGDGRDVTTIRGISSTSYDPSVATYIDGVCQFMLDTYIPQLWDVERIEIVRGPQGDLYGRNAMGGVINVITRQPSDHTDLFAEISMGNYRQQRWNVNFRSPLKKNKLYAGAALMYNKRDGFYFNEFTGSSFDKQHQVAGNFYLKYQLSSRWQMTANFKNFLNRNRGGFTLVMGPDYALENPFVVNQNAVAMMKDNTSNSSLSINYSGKKFNFSSQTSYQYNYRIYDKPIDADFGPIDGLSLIKDYGRDWNTVKVLTQELRFSSPAQHASGFNWQAGLFLYRQVSPTKLAAYYGADAKYLNPDLDTDFSTINSIKNNINGISLFTHAEYTLDKKVKLFGGFRYDAEHKMYDATVAYNKGNVNFDLVPETSASKTFSSVSPKAGILFSFPGSAEWYISYSKGYRTGGFTQVPEIFDFSQPTLQPYQPEYSHNFETGLKKYLFDKKLSADFSAFYTTVSNAQLPTLVLPAVIVVTANTGKLISKGFEAEINSKPVKNLVLQYRFGYTQGKYSKLQLPVDGTMKDMKGKHPVFTPEYTSFLSLQYSITFRKSRILPGLQWSAFGKQYFDLSNTISQNPYSLLKGFVSFSYNDITLKVWGNNLLNKKYIAYAYDFGAVHLGDPQTYGMSLSFNINNKNN